MDQVAFVSEAYHGDGTVTYVWRSLAARGTAGRQFLRVSVEER